MVLGEAQLVAFHQFVDEGRGMCDTISAVSLH